MKRKLVEKAPDMQTSEYSLGLRRKLVSKVPESLKGQPVENTHTSHGEVEKNVKWLNKQLREAQDLIIQLREEKRVSELDFERHLKECGLAIDDACASLSNAQSKLRKSALLFKQVRSLKRQNLSLKKENRSLKQRMQVDDEARRRLELLTEVAEI
jgi:hypothetical protein